MDEPRKVAFCAPGLEIPARFALIENARDVDDATAEIRQTPYVGLGDVIVADMTPVPFEPLAFQVVPPRDPRPLPRDVIAALAGLPVLASPVPIIISGC